MKPRCPLLLLGLAMALAACTPATKDFQSAEGRFSVQVPVDLQESVKPAESEIGPLAVHSFVGHGKTHTFSITYTEYPLNQEYNYPTEMLKMLREKIVAATKGNLISEKFATREGHPSSDLVMQVMDAGTKAEFRDLIILAGHRIYQFNVEAPEGKMNAAATAVFLESVKILPPPPVLASHQLFQPAGGNFTLMPPVTLTATIQQENSAAGPLLFHFFTGSEGGPAYIATYYDSPSVAQKEPQAFLKSMAENSVAKLSGKIQSEKVISLGVYPGLEYIYTFPQLEHHFTGKNRLYVAGSRIYQTQVTVAGDAPSPEADTYLDSFTITAPTILPQTVSSATEKTPVELKSVTGQFSIMTPIPLTESSKLSAGASSQAFHQFLGQVGTRAYLVAYSEYPTDVEHSDPDARLSKMVAAEVNSLNGKIETDSKIIVEGHPGRDVTFVGVQNGTTMRFKARSLLVGNRLYHILVNAEINSEKPELADDFIQSFKLEPAP